MRHSAGTWSGKTSEAPCVPLWGLILGCGFRLPSLCSIENPGSLVVGYPGFWFAVAPC